MLFCGSNLYLSLHTNLFLYETFKIHLTPQICFI